MPDFRTLDEGDFAGKRVLLRVDLNVPVKNGKVTDATRIERVVPTIKELSDGGAKVILLAHFGRPKDGPDPSMSLKPIAQAVEKALGRRVGFAADCIGEPARKAVEAMTITMLPEDAADGKASKFVGTDPGIGNVADFEGTVSGEIDGKPAQGEFKE